VGGIDGQKARVRRAVNVRRQRVSDVLKAWKLKRRHSKFFGQLRTSFIS